MNNKFNSQFNSVSPQNLFVENLEDRLLLSANVSVVGNTLAVQGSAADDMIEVRQIGTQINVITNGVDHGLFDICLLYTSPSPRDQRGSRMPSSA